jgi:DNA-binding NtrC family response regulator
LDIQPRVLVVDADTATLTSVASVAEEEGFDVRTATDVHGAMRQCRSGYIDLVMIDAALDSRSEAGVLNSIRTFKPSVRAVLMQGASATIEPFAGRADVIEHVEKPLGVDRLHQLFARLRTEAWHAPWTVAKRTPRQSSRNTATATSVGTSAPMKRRNG